MGERVYEVVAVEQKVNMDAILNALGRRIVELQDDVHALHAELDVANDNHAVLIDAYDDLERERNELKKELAKKKEVACYWFDEYLKLKDNAKAECGNE